MSIPATEAVTSTGLYQAPTVVNNVETIMNVPDIVTRGGEWFANLGMGKSGGTRIVCVSGHVVRPGVYELPMGIPLREVIYEVCGGVKGGRALKGVIPGGSSMPILDPSEIDQMVADAQAHAGEDRRRREEIDARNELD